MKILHICNDYCGSKVHANLYQELDRLGVNQTVYTCCKANIIDEKNKFDGLHTNFVYKRLLTTKHRLLYHLKIKTSYNNLVDTINPKEYDLSHAVTLFADGAVAYRLYKEYGVPYIVTVRNTDINEFLAVAPHTWPMAVRILLHAKKIIFISKAPKDKFCRHFIIKRLLPKIQQKFVIQPNGIEDFWLDNVWKGEKNLSHNIIYVGRFDVNKNVVRLISAVLQLRSNYPDIHLHLVGGDGWREKDVLKLVSENPSTLTYHGKIYKKEKLMNLYRECSIFAMPSIHETFGLVYIEALSQGLSVLYTKDQGIDGLLDERVGEKVKALSTKSICAGLDKMLSQRKSYLSSEVMDFERFRWKEIGDMYHMIYKNVICFL